MRTTVDLPPSVHRRARALATARGQPRSAVLADLTARGLGRLDEPIVLRTDERSGLPVLSVGRRVTSHDVAAALDEE